MQLARTALQLLTAICLLSTTAITRAEDNSQPPPGGPGMAERCKQNPVKCEKWKKQHGRGGDPKASAPNP